LDQNQSSSDPPHLWDILIVENYKFCDLSHFNQPWEQNWQPHLIWCNWSKMHQAASLRIIVKQGKNPRDQCARILTRLRDQAFRMHNASWWLETQFTMLDTKCWAVLHKFIDPFLFLR
jgi:hypothetical protein